MGSYPTDGARVSAQTGKSKFTIMLEQAQLGDDYDAVALYANFILNTSPGWIPSAAAAEAVRQYRANPDAVRERESGKAIAR